MLAHRVPAQSAASIADLMTVRREHEVQFYESDAELAASVLPYLVAGARRCEALVVIAETTHLRDFETGLEAEGIDLVQARAAGRLVPLDAHAILAALRPAGQLDRVAFDETLRGVLRAATREASSARVYGEMAGLLWRAGHVAEAIEIERLWNQLAGELRFSLYCAYPAVSLDGSHRLHALHELCELHSVVVASSGSGPRTGSMRLLPEREACATARRFVRSTLRRWGLTTNVVEGAVLVSSELAANAIVHARSPFLLEIGVQDGSLRVSVSDAALCRAQTGQ